MLKLYQFETCPFCARVRNFLDKNNLEYETVEVSLDTGKQREILVMTGDTQVPVLRDGYITMNESLDII
jgi:glutaredoxin 3